MKCVSCDICVYHLWFVCVYSLGYSSAPQVTGACPVTTDLIMRVNARTTTTRGSGSTLGATAKTKTKHSLRMKVKLRM